MSIRKLLRLDKAIGDVGVEIEVEGQNLPREINDKWRVEGDGSLRGEAREYVFRRPLDKEEAFKTLSELKTKFDNSGAVFEDTGRAGVHVHVNYQHLEMHHVINSIVLYFIFEDLLVNMCGGNRAGNLFCLRARDAEAIISDLEGVDGNLLMLCNDNYRYAALNLKALTQYGSLEYRAMRSTLDMKGVLEPWIELLLQIREHSQNYAHPSEILQEFSVMGVDGFLQKIFGVKLSKLLKTAGYEQLIQEGVWRTQVLAFRWDNKRMDAHLGVNKEAVDVELGEAPPRAPFELNMGGVGRPRIEAEPVNPVEVIGDIRYNEVKRTFAFRSADAAVRIRPWRLVPKTRAGLAVVLQSLAVKYPQASIGDIDVGALYRAIQDGREATALTTCFVNGMREHNARAIYNYFCRKENRNG